MYFNFSTVFFSQLCLLFLYFYFKISFLRYRSRLLFPGEFLFSLHSYRNDRPVIVYALEVMCIVCAKHLPFIMFWLFFVSILFLLLNIFKKDGCVMNKILLLIMCSMLCVFYSRMLNYNSYDISRFCNCNSLVGRSVGCVALECRLFGLGSVSPQCFVLHTPSCCGYLRHTRVFTVAVRFISAGAFQK